MRNLKKFADSSPEFGYNVLRRLLKLIRVDIFTTLFLFAFAGAITWVLCMVVYSFMLVGDLISTICCATGNSGVIQNMRFERSIA
jgi:hypothetical protein